MQAIPAPRMNSTSVRIVFTDLDGTLLDSRGTVSRENLACLHRLGTRNIIRVIATGRSQYSFKKVICQPFPADYLIFSSGTGIINLHDGQLLHASGLSTSDISSITEHLQAHQADFMVHHPVPDNHRFVYCGDPAANEDFSKRIQLYRSFADEYGISASFPDTAAQIIAILSDDTEHFSLIKTGLRDYQVTRTTSPLDHRSIWMEIQPRDTHKGSAASWLCNHLDIDRAESVGIGNDYNDLDLLDFTLHSYLLGNAPVELHDRYRLGPANDENGFSKAVGHAMGQI